jgi:transcriptional regulator with XRE-family HTH domain
MPQGIDPEWLGERLRGVRKKRELTLQDVAEQTGISIATLSRIERGAALTVQSDTLVILADWMDTEVNMLKKEPSPVKKKGRTIEYTPDIVELHLRADKNLDRKTAIALAKLFRSVYEQLTEQMKKGER